VTPPPRGLNQTVQRIRAEPCLLLSIGKCRKLDFLPAENRFHSSLGRELEGYLKARQKIGQFHKGPDSPFFIRDERRSVSVPWISNTLRDFLRKVGLKPSHGRIGPRPYDTRHTFAVHRLTRWYREGVDLHARLVWLSAYMGHLNLAGTEIYLTATPELMALASYRFNKRYKAGKKTP